MNINAVNVHRRRELSWKAKQLNMNFTELPLELVDEILKRLDAISLAKSRQVCRAWQALHSQAHYKFLWKQACIKDINEDVLFELTGNRYKAGADENPGSSSSVTSGNCQGENSVIDWEAIYKKWFRSRHIGRWPNMVIEFSAHKGDVWDVKFSGARVVTCGQDCTIRIWDSWTGHCVAVLPDHRGAVVSMSLRQIPDLSPDADFPHDLMVSGSEDSTVKVWNMKTLCAVPMLTYRGHMAAVNCVAVRENTAASAGDDCAIKIWDVNTGHCFHTLSNFSEWVEGVSMERNVLLSVVDNGQLGLWSVEQGLLLSSVTLTDDERDVNVPPFSPGIQGSALRGKTALVLAHCNQLFAWENRADGSSIVHKYSLTGQNLNGVELGECLAMYGDLVAIGTRHGSVCVYHLNGNWESQFTQVHCMLQGDGKPVYSVSLDDDGEGPTLITGGEDGMVRVYRWFPPST